MLGIILCECQAISFHARSKQGGHELVNAKAAARAGKIVVGRGGKVAKYRSDGKGTVVAVQASGDEATASPDGATLALAGWAWGLLGEPGVASVGMVLNNASVVDAVDPQQKVSISHQLSLPEEQDMGDASGADSASSGQHAEGQDVRDASGEDSTNSGQSAEGRRLTFVCTAPSDAAYDATDCAGANLEDECDVRCAYDFFGAAKATCSSGTVGSPGVFVFSGCADMGDNMAFVGKKFDLREEVYIGFMLPVRAILKTESSLSMFGMACFASMSLVIDCAYLGPTLFSHRSSKIGLPIFALSLPHLDTPTSLQSPSRINLNVVLLGVSCFKVSLSLVDAALLSTPVSLRRFSWPGRTLSVANHVHLELLVLPKSVA